MVCICQLWKWLFSLGASTFTVAFDDGLLAKSSVTQQHLNAGKGTDWQVRGSLNWEGTVVDGHSLVSVSGV